MQTLWVFCQRQLRSSRLPPPGSGKYSVCGRFGLWPFRSVAISVCGRSGLWPFFRLWPFRFVACMTCYRHRHIVSPVLHITCKGYVPERIRAIEEIMTQLYPSRNCFTDIYFGHRLMGIEMLISKLHICRHIILSCKMMPQSFALWNVLLVEVFFS